MGIPGLLKGLQFCSQKRHIRDFSNQVLAVDASSWLHKSVYSVSERYVESLDTDRLDHISVQVATKYIVARCQELLLHANIRHIYLTLDGKRCPLKAQTNQDREERRQKNLADARRFKQAGRPDKAQEKYKACIKISSEMANAVAKEVARRFVNDGRVTCVYSPYEADAQLVKLCMDGIANAVVTEDSDVLVYSASCNFSFPILYKLERDTGACDVITLEWLLNPQVQPNLTLPSAAAAGQKSAGALESILKSLVSRQSRRPGVGARLFVQGCVLAGCDYCPSELNGVGLVTAFKLVRDNAHRPAADRFQKALKSLSKKARGNINATEYEELLSKSEAVFYYHPVLDMTSKKIIPLMSLRTAEEINEADLQIVADTHPSLYRFDEDWSFLGDMTEHGVVPANLKRGDDDMTVDTHVPLPEIVIKPSKLDKGRKKKSSSKTVPAPQVYDGGEAAIAGVLETVKKSAPVANPYAKPKKRQRTDGREPLSAIGAANNPLQSRSTNPFSSFSHNTTTRAANSRSSQQHNAPTTATNASGSAFSVYQNQQDPRFVKRNFSQEPKRYAKMLAPKKSSQGSRSKSRARSISLQQNHSVNESSLQNSYRQEEMQEQSSQHFSAPPQHMEQNIFVEEEKPNIFAEPETNSFCYSEMDHVDTRNDLLQEPSGGIFDQTDAMDRREEMDYPETNGNEPIFDDVTTTMPFGNPDFAPDTHDNSTHLSVDQQSAATTTTARRVTMDDDNDDDDAALYDEFNAAASRSVNATSHVNDYQSDIEEEPMQRSRYFTGANPSSRGITRNNDETNGHYGAEETIDEFTTMSFAPSFPPGPPFATNNYGNANDGLSLSSCEDIGSPAAQQGMGGPTFHNTFDYDGWNGTELQDEVSDVAPRAAQHLAPIFQQSPPSTFRTGTTPPIEPRSPLSVASPVKRGATLNIQSRPAAQPRGRNKGASVAPKRGLITSFYPVKQSPPDEHEFARY